ncbi:hypothetical protein BGW36DRAFT_454592 [Talaromyces proteolyticus]|uniref:Uncharacterized protein n=1 Tax=Talaromyces proteolyticus TaxID=1131652 RepID=A0AAD4KLW4_9EURO|nr:uncharacterized protein BGW36DRAFT_454592 [Talaromyces proteolyticus]KAH8694056.1 hypothetical protein BGW36DRAFT_454592 [Talaromyces proteolyticus]
MQRTAKEITPRTKGNAVNSSQGSLKRSRDSTAESPCGDSGYSNPDGSGNDEYSPKKPRQTNTRSRKTQTKQAVKKTDSKDAIWKELQKTQKKLDEVVVESIQNARKGGRGLWDDTRINTAMENIVKETRTWVDRWVMKKNVPDLINPDEKNIMSYNDQETRNLYKATFFNSDLPKIKTLSKGGELLLEAILLNFICQQFLGRQFAFLDTVVKEQGMKKNPLYADYYERAFYDLALSIKKVDPFQSQKLVAGILMSASSVTFPKLDEEGTNNEQKEQLKNDKFLQNFETALKDLAKYFLEHPSKPLLELIADSKREKRKGELVRIFRHARELGFFMWSQPATVKIEWYGSSAFDPAIMELHNLASRGRDKADEEESLRGDRILININPTVTGISIDPEDQKREVQKTWLKARVWTNRSITLTDLRKLEKAGSNQNTDPAKVDVSGSKDMSTEEKKESVSELEATSLRKVEVVMPSLEEISGMTRPEAQELPQKEGGSEEDLDEDVEEETAVKPEQV